VSIARVFPSPLAAKAPAPYVAATTGQRCEVKYWATEAQAAALLKQASEHMDIDPYCLNGPQRNISVYLDSPRRTFFEMHRTGAVLRYKLRVRTYDNPKGPAFLEVKCKAKSTTMKQRTTVTQALGRAVVSGRLEALAELPRTTALSTREREVLDQLPSLHTIEEIADRLAVSANTVKTHMKNTLARLDAKNRSHAVAIALRESLIV